MLRLTTLALLVLTAQQPPPNSALIVGRVLDQADGKPIGGAVVELAMETPPPGTIAQSGALRRQIADSRGRFAFRELPGGTYSVRVTSGGTGFSPNGFIQNSSGFAIGKYLDGGYGQRRPGGALQPMPLAEGQAIPDLVIQLWRGAALSGVVVDDTGEPVVDTVVGAVQVSSDGRLLNGPTVRTDDRGMYRLSALAPGRYIVFVPQTSTAMSAESAQDLMSRVAEIRAGATPGAPAAPVPDLTGIRVGGAIVKTASSGLIDGNIMPRRSGDAVFVFQTTFHPSAVSVASAAPVELAAGEDRTGIDVSMQPVRAVPVSGTLSFEGKPAVSVQLRLVSAGASPDASLFETAIAQTDAMGRFTFPLVPVGNYTLMAVNGSVYRSAGSSGSQTAVSAGGLGAWLTEPLSVGPDGLAGLAVSLKPGLSIRGSYRFAGSSPLPSDADLARLTITVRAASPRARSDSFSGGPQAAAGGSGSFGAIGLPPGRYVLRVLLLPPASPWRVQSVLVAGREVNDIPFDINEDLSNVEVVFTDRPASVSGRVTSTEPGDGAAAVLLFPSERSLWPEARAMSRRFRLARTSASGDFRVADVPPGDYLAVAVTDTSTASWPDVSFLTKLLAAATPVRVTAGGQHALSLTVARIQ